jgi:hypothetical protein
VKEVVYAGGSFVTGDEIADALLDVAAALAEAQLAETVEVPVVGPSGTPQTAAFLIGPASQIVAEPLSTAEGEELVDDTAVARLRRIERRTRPSVVPEDGQPEPGPAWDDGYDGGR